ncbi:c-type cytochrome [Oceanospirillum maris]|jgi:cytochrome c556|uniref:c-type cytochrome n=1 Tax=Oceanospirillum maris TaxID=64977 RepID=UPI00041EC2AB|nr:cytochrome c [Oceanospirillum maris]
MRSLIVLLLSLSVFGSAVAADYSDPDVAIKARQDQFEDIKASFKQLRFEVIQKNLNVKAATQYANELADLSQPLLDMFRVRSHTGDTKALDRIWDNWPRFEKQMLEFQMLTEKAAESLKYANHEDARMYVDQAAKTCKGCHRLFKAR